ncbi:MAG TPA: toll/interleukin-1 receptor domain-containing protein [Anaeromyxobacteraceae bacterium]|nr:toll/interleukin-1 receptor domain-containing protein [Anaeromyxobacteraceae bacterium]
MSAPTGEAARPAAAPSRARSRSGRAVFINYRREDSGGQARALLYALEQAFPRQVFMDVKGLEPGVNYMEEIERTVGSCRVVLVLIGRNWATIADASGRRRLKDPRDVVSLEIATALKRQDVLVVPVLVGGATLPSEEDLPPALLGLLHRQCLQLTEQDWDYNVSLLVDTLRRRLPGGAARRVGLRGILLAALLLAVAGATFALLRRPSATRSGEGHPASHAGGEAGAAAAAPPERPPPAAPPASPPPRAGPAPAAPPQKALSAAPPAPPPAAVAVAKSPARRAERPSPAAPPSTARDSPSASAVAASGAVAPEPAQKAGPERASFATRSVVSFQQYLGNPDAKEKGRELVGSARWVLDGAHLTFAPANQAPGFFPMTVRAVRDADQVFFEGVRSAQAGDGMAYVRISGTLALSKPPPSVTLDLEFGRAGGSDNSKHEPTFKAQTQLVLAPE